MNSFLHNIVYAAANRVAVIIENARRQRLLDSLKACGDNISVWMPLCIGGAEQVEIGSNVGIAPFVQMWGGGGIKIGNHVMIGSHSAITSETHDYTAENMFKTHLQKRIVIEDDVWIGSHSIIMPGVTIHRGAVIGAGAVVTKDVEPNAIVAGVPARVMKYRELKGQFA